MSNYQPVDIDEIDASQSTNAAVSTSDTEILQTRLGRRRRSALIITPTTSGVVVYISFGDRPAVATTGIVVLQNQPMQDTDSGDTYKCWQGAVHAIASGAGNVSIMEKF